MTLVQYSVADGVAHLRLNRPGSANAFDLEAARAFRSAVDRAGDDDAIRAILVSGEGSRFCAGGDVASFRSAPDHAAFIHQLASELDDAFQALAALPVPVVAAVHGAVAGAGLGLLLTADVAVAAPGTRFAFAYTGVGLTPDCGVSWLLPRAVGSQRALAFALTGQVLDAATAQEWGLVALVDEDPLERATGIAAGWAAGPATALGLTRTLMRAGWESDRAEAGAREADTIAAAMAGPEAQALVAAFLSGGR